MKTLYKLHFDCGRKGTLYGLFVADDVDLQNLVESGKSLYFGEVLGKHSSVSGPLDRIDYTKVTQDPEVIKMVEVYNLEVGYNPMNYVEGAE